MQRDNLRDAADLQILFESNFDSSFKSYKMAFLKWWVATKKVGLDWVRSFMGSFSFL